MSSLLTLFHNQGRGAPVGLPGGRNQRYINKVLGIEPANLIAYWPQNEASGITADNAEGTVARDGTYTSVALGQLGIGDGNTCPLYDGAASILNIYSASLRDAFNGDEGTLAVWARVSGAGVWTDGTTRYVVNLRVDANNYIYIIRSSVNNTLLYRYMAGGTLEANAITLSDTGWIHLAMTWSAAADEVKYYLNGSPEGATDTALGTWAGNLSSSNTVIGAANTVPQNVWDGYIAHTKLWTKPLTGAQIGQLAQV